MYQPNNWCFSNCPFIRNHQANPQTYVNIRNPEYRNPVSVTTKEIRDQTKYITSDLKVPEIRGIKNINIEKNINNSISSDVMEFKRQMQEAAAEEAQEAAAGGKKFITFVVSSIYELTYNKNNIMSLSMVYQEFVNGLNRYIKVPYNYDIVTGRSLSLADLFLPGVDYKTLINRQVRAQIMKNKGKYFPGALEKFKGVAEDQPFYLENGYLVVFFGFNEIAPTEATIPLFKIPLAAFGDKIKPALLRKV